ncbi:MAG TPA: pseudouridine-5'-phosphate glycosidase [Actinomycetota bacterium]
MSVVPSLEVERALEGDAAVVALETSVVAQGLPSPRNLECVERMTAAVRASGAVPAWTGVVDGEVRVGLEDEVLSAFAEPGRAAKVARRDLSGALATGGLGATTVSSTIWAAAALSIPLAATGGIGGVHPGTGDVSADLAELSRSRILLVCSGPKSIVDPVATAERLEELGVALVGYATDRMPFFLALDAGVELDQRVDDPASAGALVRAMWELPSPGAVLLCNPIPSEHAMDAGEVAAAVRGCGEAATLNGVRGKALTPFLLSCVAERTGGASLEANLALLEANARLAGEVAVAASVV